MPNMVIAHISDIHLGGDHFVLQWADRVADFIKAAEPDLLVLTGDLTTEGHAHEFEAAAEFISRLAAPARLVVPGNHDARNEGYAVFEEMFGTRYPFYESGVVSVLGVDSSQPDIDDGHVGRTIYPLIASRLSNRRHIRILAMHHHLIPIPGTGRERHIPTDAGDLLRHCVEDGIDLVLSGHKHRPWVWRLESTHFVTAGTATTRRLKGRALPAFNLIRLDRGLVSVLEVTVPGGESREIVRFECGSADNHDLAYLRPVLCRELQKEDA